MEAIEELAQLSESMRQAAALLADEDIDENSASSSKRNSTFLNVVALGNTGAGKSAVLNSLIGHPALPTGEGGATRAPICIDLTRDSSLSSKSIVLQIDSKSKEVTASSIRHSLQDRLSKMSGKSRDEIYLNLRTSTGPPLKLVDLPGVEKGSLDDSVSRYAEHNDSILLIVVPAVQAPEISSCKALRIAKEFDGESTRTVGVISKIDQAASDSKALAAVQALLLNQGPRSTSDIPFVALIGQSVSIASSQSGSDNSLETAWRAEAESLKSILTGAPQHKLGRLALVETLAQQIRSRMKIRLPNLLTGLQGKSQVVQDELVRLGESLVNSSEGTRALALELCREFEDKFLQHITGEGDGWKVVGSFEGNFPNRIKQLPLDKHFDINNVKRIVLEADGYQPYLISPEKGLRSLIKIVLELAKEPSRLCVDEVHRVLVDIISTSANATPGLGRYPPFKREVIAIATTALEGFKNEAKNMVVALVDMERAFVPPQHFIRLVQRRMDRQRREEELKGRSSKKANEAEQSILNRATSPQTGGNLKSMKDKSGQQEKDAQEGPALKTAGPEGEITAGFLLKKSAKTNGWSRRWFVLNEKTGKLGYTKKQEERHFRGVITLEDCNLEEVSEEEEAPSKSSKDKKANGPDAKVPNFVFKITSRVPYKTVLKAHSAVVLKAESMADKTEWLNKLKNVISLKGGQVKSESGPPSMRQSLSEGSLDTMTRRPADPEEELRWMSQEVRGYVEAVLNSLAANVPKAVVLCQVEKAKEDMLTKLYSSISAQSIQKIEELLMEDHNVKRKRERCQKQSSLLSKLTRQLSVHDTRAAAASYSDGGGAESSPRTPGPASGDDWRSAFDGAANGPGSSSRYGNGHSRRNSDPEQNGDAYSRSDSISRRTPNRLPPAPPQSGSGYRF
ncbi:membrane traffic protein [Lithospermum erythrorhizon]|uniref:dynamin GTPase n=1 Tax=Lithospermum erythrorhizon TaxID=34254 RepID=A0AAV3Q498_LITER